MVVFQVVFSKYMGSKRVQSKLREKWLMFGSMYDMAPNAHM